ncbi:MAG TPA: ABC transporter permease [Candidatus Binatus sp.]|nr:ABC transporter permease [Candidatus Binatus sp.]
MGTLIQDVRYALRGLAKARGFAVVALLSLAIGIGANTAIFSIVNTLLLCPLPYKDANRLAILWNRSPGLGITEDWFSTAQYFDIKTGHHGFEDVAIAIGGNENLTGDGEPDRVGTIHVSSNLLPMLGVTADRGRLFVSSEDLKGSPGTAVLSYGFWVRRYGSDPQVIGKSLTINGSTYQVIGILPRSFSLPREVLPTLGGAEQAEIVLPLPLGQDAPQNRDREDYNIVAKLKSGVSLQQAQAEMNTITARLRRDYPANYPPNGGLTFGIVPLSEQVVGDSRSALFVLLFAVAFVLLIACANVANLQLSRAFGRQKEIALRMAIGASGMRIARQLITESLLLSVFGGAFGILLAFASLKWVRILGPGSIPRLDFITIDARVLLFTLLLSLVSGTMFGLIPSLRISLIDIHSTLKEGGRASADTGAMWGRGRTFRKSLVVSELALSVLLLIGAALLVRSFANLESVSPGFNAKNVLTMELTMNGDKYREDQFVLARYKQIGEQLERIPGVKFVGAITSLPLSQMFAWGPITVEGRIPPSGENFINADVRVVNGHYFEAMQIPLREGRFFNQSDIQTSAPVGIVDEYMARELWPNQSPLGKRVHNGGITDKDPWITVVGVVGRIKQYTLDSDSRIAIYYPQTQFVTREMNVVVRTDGDPAALYSAARKEIQNVDPDLPIFHPVTMDQRVQESLARRRFSMLLLSLFAGLAVALAMVGIYGVVSYVVNQGRREIGIRLALGATPRAILHLVIGRGMALAIPGVLIGLFGSLVFTRMMRGLLFGVRPIDPFTFVAIPMLLVLVALLASYIPARRATRVDPTVSLRSE